MPPKILIADDSPVFREALACSLSAYTVDCVPSADEVIKQVKKGGYSLIIADKRMDGNDNSGLFLIEKVRKSGNNTPIFLISSEITSEIRESTRRLGANEVFEKPFDRNDFLRKVRQYVKE